MRIAFEQMDTDHDGMLTHAEILETMKGIKSSLSGGIGNDPNWDSMLKNIDADKDGRISYEEFTIAAHDKSKLVNKENLQAAFDFLDIDKDGRISAEELSECLATTTLDNLKMHSIEMSDKDWERLIEDCDLNKDGYI